jgi:hypothetical protein
MTTRGMTSASANRYARDLSFSWRPPLGCERTCSSWFIIGACEQYELHSHRTRMPSTRHPRASGRPARPSTQAAAARRAALALLLMRVCSWRVGPSDTVEHSVICAGHRPAVSGEEDEARDRAFRSQTAPAAKGSPRRARMPASELDPVLDDTVCDWSHAAIKLPKCALAQSSHMPIHDTLRRAPTRSRPLSPPRPLCRGPPRRP